jgi:hypothetical protein
MNGYILNPEVIERNQTRLATKTRFVKLAFSVWFKFHVTSVYYDVKKVVVEDGEEKFVIKDIDTGILDHYLIPLNSRDDYYIKDWVADTLIIRKRKNRLKFNQISSVVNVLSHIIF